MTFPATLTLVTVRAAFASPPSGGATGRVRYEALYPLIGAADNAIVRPFTTVAVLDADGVATAELPATDDPQWVPVAWAYRVTCEVDGQVFTGTLQLSYLSATAELADLLQLDGAAQPGITYIPLSQRSIAGGVAALDADGDVTDAVGNKITGGGGGGGVTSVAGKTGTVTLVAADISNSTSVGRAVLTAEDAAAARTAIGAQAAGGGGGAARRIATGYVTSGDLTPQNTGSAWQLLTGGPSFTIAATAGDVVTFDFNALIDPASSTFFDIAVVVSGAAVMYASSGGATPAIEGDPGLYPDLVNFQPRPGTFAFVVQSGHLSGGNVTLRFAVNSAGSGKLYAGAAFPLRWTITSETPAA